MNVADALLKIGCYLEETEADFETFQAWAFLRDESVRLMAMALQLQTMREEQAK